MPRWDGPPLGGGAAPPPPPPIELSTPKAPKLGPSKHQQFTKQNINNQYSLNESSDRPELLRGGLLLNPPKFPDEGPPLLLVGGGSLILVRELNGGSKDFLCSRLVCACFRLSLKGFAKLTSIVLRPRF